MVIQEEEEEYKRKKEKTETVERALIYLRRCGCGGKIGQTANITT